MVGSIAHEINNLVHPIVNLSRLAMEAPALDEPYRRWLGIIHQSGQRAGEIVADVLGLSRSRAESQRAPFGQAVAEAVATLDTLGGAQLKIEARIESLTGPDVKSTLVFQILSNLVSNASRAMDHAGPVAIRYREIDAREGARLFELTVTDSGVGMNETSRRRALEPLFTATRDGEGAGLGLSIVREIVESLNGEITIESRQGFGTSVAIVTPWPIIETPLQRAGE
jgi:signal transduction histidine kinase